MSESNRGRIFVTGINGHIGNHIVKDLLEHGYTVRGSVRDLHDETKTAIVRAHAARLKCPERLEIVEADVLTTERWDEFFDECIGVFHTATVYSTKGKADVIVNTAITGTRHVLESAARAGIPRVVYTSSAAAIGSLPKGEPKTEAHWQTDSTLPYTKAKHESEVLAWDIAKEHGLDLRVINPTAVLGGSFYKPTPSVDYFDDLLKGKLPLVPQFPMAFVHVRDVAKAHRLAFEIDEAEGRFLLAPHHSLNLHELAKQLAKLYPNHKVPTRRLPNWMVPMAVFQDWFLGLLGSERRLTRKVATSLRSGDAIYDSSKAQRVLGIEWEDFDTCLIDTAEAILLASS